MSAFVTGNFSANSYDNGIATWLYKTNGQSITDIMSKAFFVDAQDMMSSGDTIIVSDADFILSLIVNSADATGVSTARLS